MDKKYNVQAIEEQERRLGRKLTAEEKEKFEIKPLKPNELQNKLFSSMSGQSGLEKKIKNKVGHMLETSNRALNKVLNKINKTVI